MYEEILLLRFLFSSLKSIIQDDVERIDGPGRKFFFTNTTIRFVVDDEIIFSIINYQNDLLNHLSTEKEKSSLRDKKKKKRKPP